MATRIYSYDLGTTEYDITDGVGSGTTKGVELTVDLAKITSKQDLLTALEKLENYITRGLWPPA